MNIKEHIEAGHYPKDHNEYSLVPMRCGRVATICSTKGPTAQGEQIVGWAEMDSGQECVSTWDVLGEWAEPTHPYTLLPPPPRKVKVTAKVRIYEDGQPDALLELAAVGCYPPAGTILELTGEYEEEWK